VHHSKTHLGELLLAAAAANGLKFLWWRLARQRCGGRCDDADAGGWRMLDCMACGVVKLGAEQQQLAN
jgi:hypothetical protein